MVYKLFMVFLTGLSFQASAQSQFQIEKAFPNLTFTRPVDLQADPLPDNRLFVVEQAGLIRVFQNTSLSDSLTTFLDIRDRVNDSGNEQGLLGLAFHPDYANNGYFYVNYTATQPNRTVISRFRVSTTDPNLALADSEYVILEYGQPYSNHNGGQLAFGPQDDYLYIAAGDGGYYGDPECNAQNLQTLLGAIHRIDVDHPSGGNRYGIPPDNPFAGNNLGYREEIFAYGLRNPWRFSFDPVTDLLWAGDVGQALWEEIDLIVSGGNYGWSMFEGTHCYNSPWPCTPPCNSSGIIMPVWEYSHSLGQSVTGGYVYRGTSVPELTGKYIYADFGSGRIWSLEYTGTPPAVNTLLLDSNLGISSFGIDRKRELYICAFDGFIYKFTPTVTVVTSDNSSLPQKFELNQNYPNPFNSGTVISFYLSRPDRVQLLIFDVQGKEVAVLESRSFSAGYHSIKWEGVNITGKVVASGIYFYKLKAGEQYSRTRQMLLLR
jgi:glucose/arabinose dehydrogenase